MKLYTDPRAALFDYAVSMVGVIASVMDLDPDAKRQMEEALVSSYAADIDPMRSLSLFTKSARIEIAQNPRTNILALAAGGKSLDENPVFHNLLSRMKGRNIVHPGSKEIAFNVINSIYVDDLALFTEQHVDIAYALLRAITRSIREKVGSHKGATELNLAVSGMLPVLVHTVVSDCSADMADMPDELLLSMYHTELLKGVPNAGVYATYLNSLYENTE